MIWVLSGFTLPEDRAGQCGLEVSERVLRDTIDANLEMKVVTEAMTRVADISDYIALAHAGPLGGTEL